MTSRDNQENLPLLSEVNAGPEIELQSSEHIDLDEDAHPGSVLPNTWHYRQRLLNPKHSKRAGLVVLSTVTAVISLIVFFFGVPESTHSTSNNLLFYLSPPSSPFTSGSLGYNYRDWVSLTAGVVPKRVHSHNDYEQTVPLLKALSYGAASVEADIWLVDNELLVGHTPDELSSDKTLSSLYLRPLQELLRSVNVQTGDNGSGSLRGVFDTAPRLPLQLLIDIKSDAIPTFEKLYTELEPLRSAGYLTTFTTNSTISPSLITVVGTGDTPLASVLALGTNDRPRDIFLDAPLLSLISSDTNQVAAYIPTVSPLASGYFHHSVGWSWVVPWVGRARIRKFVEAAHAKGLQARFWGVPSGLPKWARNFIWQMLLDEGADWLNVDDLPAASAF